MSQTKNNNVTLALRNRAFTLFGWQVSTVSTDFKAVSKAPTFIWAWAKLL